MKLDRKKSLIILAVASALILAMWLDRDHPLPVHVIKNTPQSFSWNASNHADEVAVLSKSLIRSQQNQSFMACLRDEHAIERISVMPRQRGHLPSVNSGHWQTLEAFVIKRGFKCIW